MRSYQLVCAAALAALAGCRSAPRAEPAPPGASERAPSPAPAPSPERPADAAELPAPAGPPVTPERSIEVLPVRSAAALRALGGPAPGEFRVHLVDVGTGLALLIEGADFRMLFDGGSADDWRGLSARRGNRSRLVAYLAAAIGAPAPERCRPVGDDVTSGEPVTLDHVFLSHPHADHGNLLDDVLRCYDVRHVWDVGVVNEAAFYADFLASFAAGQEAPLTGRPTYHTAAPVPPGRTVQVRDERIRIEVPWEPFEEGQVLELGAGARLRVLHADWSDHSDFNENSLVLRVELGETSLLLTGDAESGERAEVEASAGGVEAALLELHRPALDVDVLQVGHHGSATSSRGVFLDAVTPRVALIGCGPKRYGSVTLPDPQVARAVRATGARLLRTDEHDRAACPEADKIGDDDLRPGGCDSYLLRIPGTP